MDIAEIRRKAKQMEAAKEAALKELAAKEGRAPEPLERETQPDEASLEMVAPPPRPVIAEPKADDDFIIDDTPEALMKAAEAASSVAPSDDSADFIIDDTVPIEPPKAEAAPKEDYLIDDTAEAALSGKQAALPSEEMEDFIIDDSAEAVAAAPRAEAVVPASAVEPSTQKAAETAVAEVEDDTGEDLEAITFIIGKEVYAIDILDIREIIKTKDLTDVPRSPNVVLGVLSLRGTVVPVMDLPTALNIKGYVQPTFMDEIGISRERIIIVRDGEELMGFKVDAIEGVVRVPRKTLEPPPLVDSLDTEMIQAIGRCEGRPFILLAVDKVLSRV